MGNRSDSLKADNNFDNGYQNDNKKKKLALI